jgi:hypothetical protein
LEALKHGRFGTTEQGRSAVADPFLASKAKAAEKETASADVTVQVKGATVFPNGRLANGSQVEAVF